MNVIVFGATGRVGRAVVEKCLAAGHTVSAFVRTQGKLTPPEVTVYRGDVRDPLAVKHSLEQGFDAVIVCIGEGALRPSTVVTQGFTVISDAMMNLGQRRFLAVSGSAEMAKMTWFGRVYSALLRRTPVGHAIRDHDGGLRVLQRSNLEWTLAGCNYLADGPERGSYRTSTVFPGGFKKICPGDAADFLVRQLTTRDSLREVVGIWY